VADRRTLDREEIRGSYQRVRSATEALCAPLGPEDMVVQTMPDVSPTKWHLAHTTWFFETFVLKRLAGGYQPFDPRYEMLFNSYYNSVGEQYPRPRRGLLSRPTVDEVRAYRRHVDAAVDALLAEAPAAKAPPLEVIEVGLHHEEQHQELILTDIKHVLCENPVRPVYRARPADPDAQRAPRPLGWQALDGGVVEIGHTGQGFAFDNERPRHRELLEPFELAERLVSCGEYRAFIEDGGYRRPELWLAEGWDLVRTQGWQAPLYWERSGRDAAPGEAAADGWSVMTLDGLRPLRPAEPVCHVSYFEADAYASWAQARLPREAEWEVVAREQRIEGNLLEDIEHAALHPRAARGTGVTQLFGDVWEWTASAYLPYPGFARWPGALGEYNGKFMSGQMVLRGGSCATPRRHLRATYRNFFPPSARWQFSGIRLAR
jgi:ergothioneine biosynthesis protein EgtB